MYKIRFHLAKGKNYLKWQIKSPDGSVEFYEPSEVTIFMRGCRLHNSTSIALKIFGGAHKEVCAWVEAVHVMVAVLPIKNIMDTSSKVLYNPRVSVNWRVDGVNVDGMTFGELFTSHRHIILGR
jgi:hypothetical protein